RSKSRSGSRLAPFDHEDEVMSVTLPTRRASEGTGQGDQLVVHQRRRAGAAHDQPHEVPTRAAGEGQAEPLTGSVERYFGDFGVAPAVAGVVRGDRHRLWGYAGFRERLVEHQRQGFSIKFDRFGVDARTARVAPGCVFGDRRVVAPDLAATAT